MLFSKPQMKVKRKTLLKIIAGMGIFIIVYSLIRQFTGFGFGEKVEKYMMDVIIFGALGLFLYNRKLAKEEKLEREAKEEAERRAAEEPEAEKPNDTSPEEDESLPHWEREKEPDA